MSIYQSVSQSIYILFREEKEKYIKAKYERKEFLAPLPPSSISPAKGLVDAICRSEEHCSIKGIYFFL